MLEHISHTLLPYIRIYPTVTPGGWLNPFMCWVLFLQASGA